MNKFRIHMALIVAGVLAFLGLASASSASAAVTAPDLTGVTDGMTSLGTTVTTILVPALVTLVLLGVAIAVGIKYFRKGGHQA